MIMISGYCGFWPVSLSKSTTMFNMLFCLGQSIGTFVRQPSSFNNSIAAFEALLIS